MADVSWRYSQRAARRDPMPQSWFMQLSAERRQQLVALGRDRLLTAGEVLFHRGDKFDGIYLLQNGVLLISGVNRHGDEALLTVIEPGVVFGEIALFDGASRTHDAIAAQPCRLLHFPAPALQQLLQQQPQWWQHLGKLLTEKMRQAFLALEQHTLLDAKARLCWRLCQLCPHDGAKLPLSQQQLAQLIGLSRQSTNQLLRALARDGVIELHYGSLIVRRIDRLHQALESAGL